MVSDNNCAADSSTEARRNFLQPEERALVILLCASLLSLMVLYFFIPGDMASAEFSANSMVGDSVYYTGEVTDKVVTASGGHLILELDGSVKVFIPGDSGADELGAQIAVGDRVRVQGTVKEYGGEIEIVVNAPEDVTSPR